MTHKQLFTTIWIVLFSLLMPSLNAQAPKKRLSQSDYVNLYGSMAVKEMKRSGVPASITLAQGMLESGNGNSELSSEANNHFGIKCHNDWDGKRVYHDDDKRNECFRRYNSVLDSYADHSEFLATRDRYAFLFNLKTTDYKGWAKGLKKAGYATDPQYANRLIKIIEDNKLYTFDSGMDKAIVVKENRKRTSSKRVDNFTIDPFTKHEVDYNNGVKYIKVNEGDSFESISEEFQLKSWELYSYNDLSFDENIENHKLLYIQPKRNKAHPNHSTYMAKEGETMQSISQKYGVKLKRLYKYNKMSFGSQPKAGAKVYLRKKRRDS